MTSKRAASLTRWIIALAIVIALALAAGIWGFRYTRPQVTVTKVVEGPVVQAFYATGTLLPDREYPIRANNPGFLVELKVDKGDVVTAGQPLAVVTEDGVRFRMNQASAERDQKAQLADTKNSPILEEFDAKMASISELVEIGRRQQKRLTDAMERGAAPQSDVDQAMDRVKTLLGELAQVKAQRASKQIELEKDLKVADAALEIARWNTDRQTVRSPLDSASVLVRPLAVGTRVAVNDQIMVVADVRPEKLIMRAQVDEEDITKVKRGGPVKMTLYAYENREFAGTVKKIYDKADPERRTFEVDVEMTDKDPAFFAGMTGELAFIMEEKAVALVVPSQALQGGSLYTVKDGRVVRLNATIGLRSVERTEVVSGLELNDTVIISPILGLPESGQVRVKLADPVQAALANRPKKQEVFKGGF